MKVITIVGARPQFVKAATVSRAFRAFPVVEEKIVHTGQHFDANMSEVFFEEMEIPQPHYNLEINSLSHGAMTGRMLEQIEKVLQTEQPGAVMVYGDTNSTLAGALAARKLQIPVFHVEAGLRSFNLTMPEEINRILTDRISSVLFCPSVSAVQNLEREGFAQFPCVILNSGDVMEDAAYFYAAKAEAHATVLQTLQLVQQDYILCTFHREENTNNPVALAAIVTALNALARQMPVVVPLHPRTQKLLATHQLTLHATIIPPVGYFDMLSLLQHARMVLTDSGGLQKEAFFFNKFCLTLRAETEWTELVNHGYNFLTGANADLIQQTFTEVLERPFPARQNFYGGGQAAQRIAQYIAELA